MMFRYYFSLCTNTAFSNLASANVCDSSVNSLLGKVVMRTKLAPANCGRALILWSRK